MPDEENTHKLLWTPEPTEYPAADEEALILSQEHLTDILQTITAEPLDEVATPPTPEPASLSWSFPEGQPPNLFVTAVSSPSSKWPTLLVEVKNWEGVFSYEVNFMQDVGGGAHGWGQAQSAHKITDWKELPAPQADIYAFYPDAKNVKRFAMVVEAFDKQEKTIEEVTYTITVYANYELGKNILKEKVRMRKDTRP